MSDTQEATRSYTEDETFDRMCDYYGKSGMIEATRKYERIKRLVERMKGMDTSCGEFLELISLVEGIVWEKP